MTTTAPAPPGPLSSDHINYLILRYLQEAGHEASATAFYRDWRRPAEYRDPEDLPFAPAVQRHELVSVIQDGLYHDELVSRVRKEGRRFNFTTNGAAAAGSRPGTAGKGKGRLDQMRRGVDDFPTPPPKRQRKSEEGREDRQVNGAASTAEPMEIDAASPSAGDADDDAEAASPAMQTPEPEIVEVPERYDSMDVAVQTEGKIGPKTSTMYWRIGKPDAIILYNIFSPAKGSRAMFTAGEGISQFYDLPEDFDTGVEKISSLDDAGTSAGSVVTACAWHPDGHALALAVDVPREIGVSGKQERRQVIKVHDARGIKTTLYHSPPLLEPQGVGLALRYSADASYLLAVRTNGFRSTVEIWRTMKSEGAQSSHADAIAWNIFDGRAVDAAWTADSTFLVCGEDGLLQEFRISTGQTNGVSGDQHHTPESARIHGLEVLTRLEVDEELRHLSFDKVRAIPSSSPSSADAAVAFAVGASEDRALIHGNTDANGGLRTHALVQDERVTAFAFRPSQPQLSNANLSPPTRVLAVAREDGRFTTYTLSDDSKALAKPARPLPDGSPALALAWSPEGSYLAVCGTDVLQIWEAAPLMAPSGEQDASAPASTPLVTWRRDRSAGTKGLRNGELAANGEGQQEQMLEPCLSWSADGESLALAVGSEIAVMRFRPPLQDGSRAAETARVNGHEP